MVMVESAILVFAFRARCEWEAGVGKGLQNTNEFQVSRLDPGLYFLLLYDEKETTYI